MKRVDERVGGDVRWSVATLRIHEFLLKWQADGVMLLESLQNWSKGIEVRRALDHEALAAHQCKESAKILLAVVIGAEAHKQRWTLALVAYIEVGHDSPYRISECAIDR